jgi:hypothetical protein
LYARLYTEVNGSWNTYTSSTFTVAYSAATMTYPNPRYSYASLDATVPFTWMPVSGASGYELWIGSSPGADDVLQSGLLSQPSFLTGPLPVGEQLWARVWTLTSGTWVYAGDVPFSAAGMITAPAQQSLAVNPGSPVSWAPGATIDGNAPSYELMIGSSPGGNDLFDSGKTSSTSMSVPASAMPGGEPLYARVVYYLGDGSVRKTDNVFAVAGSGIAPAQMNWGTNGSSAVDTSLPFAWSADNLAQAYRLEILSGGTTVADSGPIQVPEYFDEGLPVGSYTAQLGTELGGAWQWTSSSFTVTNSGSNATNEIAAAHWATDYVRQMADTSSYAYAWTELYHSANLVDAPIQALCGNYATELLNVLKEMNIAATLPASEQPEREDLNFISNGYDGHVIVYFWDRADSDFIVLDPTFDIAMKLASTGDWATAAQANAATVAQNWSAIQYVPLGGYGLSLAESYYLDYPLLYLNLPPDPAVGSGADPTPYLTKVTTWPTNQPGEYILQGGQASTTVIVNGSTETMATDAVGGFGVSFSASSVSLPPGSTQTATLYSENRYVFTNSSN